MIKAKEPQNASFESGYLGAEPSPPAVHGRLGAVKCEWFFPCILNLRVVKTMVLSQPTIASRAI